MMTAEQKAIGVAEMCGDAYSSERYRDWAGVAEMLLRRGHTELEAEAIMRSKWTRWAADGSPFDYGEVPAQALADYLDAQDPKTLKAEVADLVAQTFGTEA